MSEWGWYRERKKRKAAPAHGIKVAKFGATWWGQRWIAALEGVSSAYSARLARGRTYARAGRVHDLVVKGDRVSAEVTGSSSRPYTIEIALTPLDAKTWDRAIDEMGKKAAFAASLLAGEMPKDIDEVFAASRSSLFPTRDADLVTDCSCPDWANPCKHIAATHYVLGEAIERDPFLLFELRGRTKVDVLGALRVARGGERARTPRKTTGPTGVKLGALEGAAYDRPAGPWPILHLTFEPPSRPGSLLAQLGRPESWRHDESPAALLGPTVRAASERARRIALAEPVATANDGER